MELSNLSNLQIFANNVLPDKKSEVAPWQYLRKVKWKNERPKKNEAYRPTRVEHCANIFTHGLWVMPVTWYSHCLVMSAVTPQQYGAAIIYGCVLIGLFSVSTFFHVFASIGRNDWIQEILHRGDRAMIYLFIAGSYTPWLTLRALPPDGYAAELRWAIWVLASLGILYQQLFHEKYKLLETSIYLFIALTPSLAVLEMNDMSGVLELQQGGAVYLLGVLFFKLDGRVPLAHAIWHLHVVVGAMIHYGAVAHYLIGPNSPAGLDLQPQQE